MTMLQRSRHWLAPLSIMLLGSTVLPASADSTRPVEITPAGTSVRADDSGDIHLRISRDLITGSPENLREALLDVILNDRSRSAQPVSIDDDGKIHYLVSFGSDEAGSEIHLKPLPANTSLEDTLSKAITGMSTILTLSVVDGLTRWRGANIGAQLNLQKRDTRVLRQKLQSGTNIVLSAEPFEPDNYARSMARNYANQAVLASSFMNGEAIRDITAEQVGPNLTGRTNWVDVLPDLSSTLAMGFSGGALHYYGDYSGVDTVNHQRRDGARSVLDHMSLYSMSSTTNTMSNVIRKFHEALLNDVTELDDATVGRIAQIAPILEGALALTALNYMEYAGPDVADGKSYHRSFLPTSLAITAIYNFRDLTSDLATEVIGDRTLGEFAATGTLLASTVVPYLLKDKLGAYQSVILGETAEAAGFSLSMAINMAIRKAVGGDSKDTQTRLMNASSGLALALALSAVERQIPGDANAKAFYREYLKPVLGSAVNGTVIVNTMELLSLAKDELVKPYLVAPLLDKLGMRTQTKAPALRLKAQITRRGLSRTA